MSVVSLLNVDVKNNPAPFAAPYEFEITFECLEPLQKDLEWKVTYVGSATSYANSAELLKNYKTLTNNSSEHDQVLDTLLVGPVPVGVNKFVFETEPPDLSKIPNTEVIGVTVVLLSCSYDDREFVRVGYYVNNEYEDEQLMQDPPAKPIIEKVKRNILAEKPRVTRFAIKWDSEESAPAEYPPEQPDVDAAEDDELAYGADEEEEVEDGDEAGPAEGAEGTEEAAKAQEELVKDDASDAGSEDLEAESEGDDDEEGDEEEEEGEGEGDGDAEDQMDTTEDGDKPASSTDHPMGQQQHGQDVMVH